MPTKKVAKKVTKTVKKVTKKVVKKTAPKKVLEKPQVAEEATKEGPIRMEGPTDWANLF